MQHRVFKPRRAAASCHLCVRLPIHNIQEMEERRTLYKELGRPTEISKTPSNVPLMTASKHPHQQRPSLKMGMQQQL